MSSNSRESLPPEPPGLTCAQGYYELGMLDECRDCLAELPMSDRLRPDGLELEALLLIHEEDWETALSHCRFSVERYPDFAFGYVNLAFVYHEIGHTRRALRLLEQAHPVVKSEPVALYNRGCYLVRLGRHTEGLYWLSRAMRGDPGLRKLALRDPDLQSIRTELEETATLRLPGSDD